ncbi:hypothetical protein HDV02_001403 [Globomyces sp. JEL0801]|nr:hypothetical protein HDV02_001403 [Globomyces sp. JEL0801]
MKNDQSLIPNLNLNSNSVVTIPQFSHATIESILEINRNIIRILIEYQNNGWSGQMEQQMYSKVPLTLRYQQRLNTNLTFLNTLADALLTDPLPNIKIPDLTPVSLPGPQIKSNVRHSNKKQLERSNSTNRVHNRSVNHPNQFNQANESIQSIDKPMNDDLSGESKSVLNQRQIIETLPTPTMVFVPDTNYRNQPYVPVPPLVGLNPQAELSCSGFQILDESTSRNILLSRLGNPKTVIRNTQVESNLPIIKEADISTKGVTKCDDDNSDSDEDYLQKEEVEVCSEDDSEGDKLDSDPLNWFDTTSQLQHPYNDGFLNTTTFDNVFDPNPYPFNNPNTLPSHLVQPMSLDINHNTASNGTPTVGVHQDQSDSMFDDFIKF